MPDLPLLAAVSQFLFREARLLDEQKWPEWLELYSDDAVFWVPATKMAGGYTSDPEYELNFIYIKGRVGIEARIFRLGTNSSMASTPPPRTRHLVTGVMIDEAGADHVRACASWQVVSFSEERGQQIRSGSYEYMLRREHQSFRIARKKILLLEHVIDGYFDVYMV
ncbi:MAG TPA: aromatic-ring-hydroxylating dioxygenase subunit beta [Stellaceae bacterium]|nr:aromatic-ring-hydroxylating dioxygenase subunit beta [Stellaceae bacterium]